MNEISYKLDKIDSNDNSCKYRCSIKLPMELGWYEDVCFNLLDGYNTYKYRLKHKCNDKDYAYFEGEFSLNTKAIYHYLFSFKMSGVDCYYNKGGLTRNKYNYDDTYKMSVNFHVPDWAKGKIMYHIFVDRFRRSDKTKIEEMPRRKIHDNWNDLIDIGPNKKFSDEVGHEVWNADFFGGNLLGIEEKLDYIKSLGVSIIYLSPIVYSQSNHRYDASDYEKVDPYLGFNEDLKRLCDEAHKRGMKVVLDAVFNHTGNDSKYFNEYNTFKSDGAFNNPNSKYAKFYKKRYVNGALIYDFWWGFYNLVEVDFNSLEFIEYITGEGGVIDLWFSLGIDGLRLDVADELTDKFIEQVLVACKRNKKDAFLLGEVWKNPMRMNRGYISSGKGMHSVMNYHFTDALLRYFNYGDCYKLDYTIKDILREYPSDTIYSLMNFTSTHDITRGINLHSEKDVFNRDGEWVWSLKNENLEYLKSLDLTEEEYNRAKRRYEAYVFCLDFLPGNLSIFYGDEAGITGYGNLLNRRTYPWGMEDKDLINFFKYIGSIRNNNKFLEKASIKINSINTDYFSFTRENGSSKSFTIVNRTDSKKCFLVPPEFDNKNNKVYTLNNSSLGVLSPNGGVSIIK